MTMTPLSAAVVLANRALREEAFDCINNLPVRVVSDQRVEDIDELLDRIERFRVDVLLLEGGLMKTPLDEFTRRLKLTASDPAIFILHSQAIPENILEAMRAGAREYICPPVGTPLKEAFERLSVVRTDQITTQQKKLGRIFGLLSAKGGCGATTFAGHLGPMAARLADKPVLLADLDFEAGLLRFILKTKPRYSLHDALENMHRMDSSYWNALVTKQGNQLEFIAAPDELGERTTPDARQFARLLRFIRSIYPVTILDFGRCYSAAALETLPELEALYLITTQDLLALENAKDFIEMADARGKGADRIQVLLNKAPVRQKPDLDNLEKFLGVRLAGVYSDDTEALYETWSEGRLLGTNSVLGRQLTTLAKSIMTPELAVNETAEATGSQKKPAAPVSPAAGLGRFLSFMQRSRA
jgi:Flp pilus assembly CpaE family ATPase